MKMNVAASSDARSVALGYIRSIDSEDSATQLQRIGIAKISEHRGWSCEYFEDNDGSGESARELPAYKDMIRRIKDSDIAAVIVYDLSRFSHKPAVASEILDEINDHNVPVVFAMSAELMPLVSKHEMKAFLSLLELWDAYQDSLERQDR